MAVRLVVTITAAPGKGSELAQAFKARCTECMQEPGCEQFEVFQSVLNPDKLALLELWKDQAALDVHAKVNETRPPMPAGLRSGAGAREDYEYNQHQVRTAQCSDPRERRDPALDPRLRGVTIAGVADGSVMPSRHHPPAARRR